MGEEQEESYKDLYKNVLNILILFNNRPNHLLKYLIDNNALNNSFVKKSMGSGKLSMIKETENTVYFTDISQMNDYYNSLLDDTQLVAKTKDVLTKELNEKLDKSILSEKFEDAIRIRDYMKKNKIKRNN
jgi:hypothetical protein